MHLLVSKAPVYRALRPDNHLKNPEDSERRRPHLLTLPGPRGETVAMPITPPVSLRWVLPSAAPLTDNIHIQITCTHAYVLHVPTYIYVLYIYMCTIYILYVLCIYVCIYIMCIYAYIYIYHYRICLQFGVHLPS